MLDKAIINQFKINGDLKDVKQISGGLIHKTFVVTFEENGQEKRYLIQNVNTNVYKNPYELMDNIEKVTNFLNKKMKECNDTKHKTLTIIKTNSGENLLKYVNEMGEEDFYRAYEFIENSEGFDNTKDEQIIKTAGRGFGNFQKMLNDFPIENLAETIKDFHNTKKRFEKFEKSIKTDSVGRVKLVKKEIDFILERKELANIILEKLENGKIPYRVAHNDTKVNNVMLNSKTKDFLAVIDLDTVMPGSGLYDYGDGIRSAASNAREDETNTNEIFIKNNLFEAYTEGFLNEMAPYITLEEVNLMGKSIEVLTFELALRFLDVYINGDTYFSCQYETHNLNRARNQINLVKDIEKKIKYMNDYILHTYLKYK